MIRTSKRDEAPTRWLALDVGGANIKEAHSDGSASSRPFEVWRRPTELSSAIASFTGELPIFDRVAITMTAELCDCFPTKAEGVLAVLRAVEHALGEHCSLVWGIDGGFHELEVIRNRPLLAAAANWLALATVAARLAPHHRGLLIDVGSTTTDIIPFCNGKVVARGRTDTERLRTGELVYVGTRRTPVCALATELPTRHGPPIGLAAELFATTLDVYLTLGDFVPDSADCGTADGRESTIDAARDRLARMIGADRETFSEEDARELSRSAAGCLLNRLVLTARRVCEATIGTIEVAVIAGSGEFLARRLAAQVLEPGCPTISLAETWGRAASAAACARALLILLNEHEITL